MVFSMKHLIPDGVALATLVGGELATSKMVSKYEVWEERIDHWLKNLSSVPHFVAGLDAMLKWDAKWQLSILLNIIIHLLLSWCIEIFFTQHSFHGLMEEYGDKNDACCSLHGCGTTEWVKAASVIEKVAGWDCGGKGYGGKWHCKYLTDTHPCTFTDYFWSSCQHNIITHNGKALIWNTFQQKIYLCQCYCLLTSPRMQMTWKPFGLILSATGSFGIIPHLFDTGNPRTTEAGDPDLGSPQPQAL